MNGSVVLRAPQRRPQAPPLKPNRNRERADQEHPLALDVDCCPVGPSGDIHRGGGGVYDDSHTPVARESSHLDEALQPTCIDRKRRGTLATRAKPALKVRHCDTESVPVTRQTSARSTIIITEPCNTAVISLHRQLAGISKHPDTRLAPWR